MFLLLFSFSSLQYFFVCFYFWMQIHAEFFTDRHYPFFNFVLLFMFWLSFLWAFFFKLT